MSSQKILNQYKIEMEIIFLNNKLDTSKEHHLLSDNEFGFKIEIKYKEDSWYSKKEITLYNYTEVHHLWSFDYMGGKSIAFESDILSTGFTRLIDVIESVKIELMDKMVKKG